MGSGGKSRIGRTCASAALCAAWALSAAAASPSAGIELRAGAVREATLAPGARHDYIVILGAGQAADVRVEQRDAALSLRAARAEGADDVLMQSDAGRGAVLPLTLVADGAARWRLSIAARKADVAASYRIALGDAHAADPADRRRAAAQTLLAQAEALRRGGQDDAAEQARALFAAAATQADAAQDACLSRMARTSHGRLDAAAGRYEQARDAAAAALAQPCAHGRAERAQAEKLLAMAQGYLGRFDLAAQAGERALALYRETDDRHYQGVMLGNLSAIYRGLGRTGQALDAAQAALALAERTGDGQGVAFARESIAAIHLARGSLALALRSYRQTLEDLRAAPYPMIEAQAWNDLGIVYRRLGDTYAAADAYGRAMAVWTREDIVSGRAETLLNIAEAQRQDGQLALAGSTFAQTLELAREHGLSSQQAHALRGLGETALAAQRWDEAKTQLSASRDLARSLSEAGAEAAAERALGDWSARRDDVPAAIAHYRRTLALLEAGGDAEQQAMAWAALAHALRRAGDPSGARAAIVRALDLVEDQRARIDDPRLRTSYFSGQRAWYAFAIDLLMQLHRAHPERGHAAQALETGERARARALQDALAERALDLEATIDPALLQEERRHQDDLRELAWRLARLDDVSPERGRLQGRLEAATRALDAVRGRIRAAHPRYAELLRPARPDLASMQRELLDPSAAVLVYWLGDETSHLWVVRRDALTAHRLPPRAVLEREVAALRSRMLEKAAPEAGLSMAALAGRDALAEADIARRARRLADQVLAPALAGARERTFVVVADGMLHLLPFALIDTAIADTGAGETSRAYVHLPSLATLSVVRTAQSAATGAIAIFADPVFEPDDLRLAGFGAPASASTADEPGSAVLRAARAVGVDGLPRLRHARDEAEAIVELAAGTQTQVALDFAASRETALALPWQNYRIAHFATHALINADHPDLSGIVLSLYDARGRARDGFLRSNDLYRLRMPVDLVVLSACESAFGEAVGSEGVFSLSRAFFHTGARRVVASLWPVDDRASAWFMRRFYTALLHDRRSPHEAVATAQAAMRAQPQWRAPFYWAGFVVQGDWR